jgi:hypothetical protein
MSARPSTVSGYVRSVAADRRREFEELRDWVRGVLPAARETMSYRMPTYEASDGGLICAIAAQKHHLALYVCQPELLARHREAFSHLDVGKGCIRFRHLADLPRTATRKLLRETARDAGGKPVSRKRPKAAPKTRPKRSSPRKVGLATLRSLALALPGVEEGTSYGTPAWRVRGKLIARLREDGDSVVMKVGDQLRDVLMEADPARYFVTDHYVGYPIVLLRLSNIPRSDLAKVLEESWRLAAPKRLRDAHDAGVQVRRKPGSAC